MGAIIGDVITPGQEKAFTVRNRRPGSLKDLAPEYKQLLTDPVTASLTTVNAKGEMQVTPVWVGNDGTYIELNSVRGRKKDRNLRSNGRVTLLFLNPKNPYHWMSLDGKVVDIIDEDDKARGQLATKSIDALALRYVNQTPVPVPGSARGDQGALQSRADADSDVRRSVACVCQTHALRALLSSRLLTGAGDVDNHNPFAGGVEGARRGGGQARRHDLA